jgi:hypothetical protein
MDKNRIALSQYVVQLYGMIDSSFENLNSRGGPQLEFEMKIPMNTHSAVRLIREFSVSAEVIQTDIGPKLRNSETVRVIPGHEYAKIVQYDESASERDRTITQLPNATDLYFDFNNLKNLASVTSHDKKRRVADIQYNPYKFSLSDNTPTESQSSRSNQRGGSQRSRHGPWQKQKGSDSSTQHANNIKIFRLSFSVEESRSRVRDNNEAYIQRERSSRFEVVGGKSSKSTESSKHNVLRYTLGDSVRDFLGLICEKSVITIERDIDKRGRNHSWFTNPENLYRLEMEWSVDEPIESFIHDIDVIYDYIIHYNPMSRPQDLNRDDITMSTFFSRGPYRATRKDDGYRAFIFLQSDYVITMKAGTEQFEHPVRLNIGQDLDVTTIDVEVVQDNKNVVLDCWNPAMIEKMNDDHQVVNVYSHEMRIEWLLHRIDERISQLNLEFKEFINLDEDYHDKIRDLWNFVESNTIYDGIILQPQYRSFYGTYMYGVKQASLVIPSIFKFKTYQSIDLNSDSISRFSNKVFNNHRYHFIVLDGDIEVDSSKVVEYRIVSVENNESIEAEAKIRDVIVKIKPIRIREDRKRPNYDDVIDKILRGVMENLTIDDLLGAQVDNVRIPYDDYGIVEVIEDHGFKLSSGSENGNRVLLFPDVNYPWPRDGSVIIIVTQSRLRLIGTEYEDSITSTSSYEELINILPTPMSSLPLFPDSIAPNRDLLNSYIVMKVKLPMFSNHGLVGDELSISYTVPRNFLSNLVIGACEYLGIDDVNRRVLTCSNIGIGMVKDPIRLYENEAYLQAPYCPTWWAPTHGYPALTVAHNFMIRYILSGNQDSEFIEKVIKYLSPLGMTMFITLNSSEMDEFLEKLEEQYGLTATCQFLIVFLIMIRYHLNVEIDAKYKGVNISSSVFATGVNVNTTGNVAVYAVSDSTKNRFSSMNMLTSTTDRLAHIPAMYFFKKDYDPKVLTNFIGICKKLEDTKTYIKIHQNDEVVVITNKLTSDQGHTDEVTQTLAKLDRNAYIAVKDKNKLTLFNQFLASGTVASFVFEKLFPENGFFQEERPYISINWSANNDSAELKSKLYEMVDSYFEKGSRSRSRSPPRSRTSKR